LDILRMLLKNVSGDQLDHRDRINGNTALHIAAMRTGGCPLVELLVAKNASLDIYNKLGQRPVYVTKDQETIDLLDGKQLETPPIFETLHILIFPIAVKQKKKDTTLFRKPIAKDFDRQCTITRAEIQDGGKVVYIIKCGTVGLGWSIMAHLRGVKY
jgi:hypothetical protein